jgi:hypothetical protein
MLSIAVVLTHRGATLLAGLPETSASGLCSRLG